ncbi:MAG: hypothetical protein KGL39_13045 [Patescibacteria group bacterium]|nr:hypothetical protein [Patescibacteria group bacterium]
MAETKNDAAVQGTGLEATAASETETTTPDQSLQSVPTPGTDALPIGGPTATTAVTLDDLRALLYAKPPATDATEKNALEAKEKAAAFNVPADLATIATWAGIASVLYDAHPARVTFHPPTKWTHYTDAKDADGEEETLLLLMTSTAHNWYAAWAPGAATTRVYVTPDPATGEATLTAHALTIFLHDYVTTGRAWKKENPGGLTLKARNSDGTTRTIIGYGANPDIDRYLTPTRT